MWAILYLHFYRRQKNRISTKDNAVICYNALHYHAPVAQLDRVSVSEAEGHEFESRRAHHKMKRLIP